MKVAHQKLLGELLAALADDILSAHASVPQLNAACTPSSMPWPQPRGRHLQQHAWSQKDLASTCQSLLVFSAFSRLELRCYMELHICVPGKKAQQEKLMKRLALAQNSGPPGVSQST